MVCFLVSVWRLNFRSRGMAWSSPEEIQEASFPWAHYNEEKSYSQVQHKLGGRLEWGCVYQAQPHKLACTGMKAS